MQITLYQIVTGGVDWEIHYDLLGLVGPFATHKGPEMFGKRSEEAHPGTKNMQILHVRHVNAGERNS